MPLTYLQALEQGLRSNLREMERDEREKEENQ
jgi:hypothetical protein